MRADTVLARIHRLVQWVLWFLLLFLLPLTSFPLVSKLSGSSTVAPLSGAVLLALVLGWFLPYLLRGGRLPFQTLPLLAFVGVVAISCAIAFFLPTPPFRDISILRSEFKALVTLSIGVLFFLTIAAWAVEEDRLRFALRIINWGGLLIILWSLAQAYYALKVGRYPQWMWNAEEFFTVGRLYEGRATGFAQEPSWLAHQLNMLYLPLWLAATLRGFTAHRLRLWKFHFEHLLLAGGLIVLYVSLSRVGMLAFFLMLAFLILVVNIRLVVWLQKRFLGNQNNSLRALRIKRIALSAGMGLVLVAIYVGLLAGIGYSLSKVDYRMARLFDLQLLRDTSFIKYANQLVIAERIVFWQAGWEVFNSHPLFGVGLGNAGYYFSEKLSPYAWALTEVRTVMYQGTVLPNIKSIWVRLLAETGIVGFAIFLGWCYALWQSARYLRQTRSLASATISATAPAVSSLAQTIGWAGSFVLIGYLIEGFSVDTFALPYFWITCGLLTGACELARRQSLASIPGGLSGITPARLAVQQPVLEKVEESARKELSFGDRNE